MPAGKGTSAQPRSTAAAPGHARFAIESLEDRTLFAFAVAPYDPSTPALELAQRLLLPNSGINITGASYVGVANQSGNYGTSTSFHHRITSLAQLLDLLDGPS